MFILADKYSIASQYLSELRDVKTQGNKMLFRNNMQRLGELMAVEISARLEFEEVTIQTPLAEAKVKRLKKQPVLVCILRAALPFYDGFLNIFDKAESAFIGAYRSKADAEHNFDIEMEYVATPDLNGKDVIVLDPMLATGKSLVKAIPGLRKFGNYNSLHIATIIASPQGEENVKSNIPNAQFYTVEMDTELNSKFYIVPGLGDAGDLAFGSKI
jgi:uracil phosphoribosyltransferase